VERFDFGLTKKEGDARVEKKVYPVEELREFCKKLLNPVINDADDCALVVDSLIEANLRGVDTHGVVRILTYYKRFKTIKWRGPEIVLDMMATGLIAGHNAPGQICGAMAMKTAINKAEQYGVGVVGVNSSNHFGTAAYYSGMPLAHGMIGFAFSNASPRIAPWGGKEAILGNNPWSFAFPTNRGCAVIQDFSNSVVAAGKIRSAAAKNEPIPLGWGADINGNPTTDAQKALKGLLLPIGEHKGYSIIMVVDILSGILTGSGFANQTKGIDDTDKPQNIGHFFGAIKIANFMPVETFCERMEQYVDLIKNSEKSPGIKEIFVPGEIEYNTSNARKQQGIPLSDDAVDRLNQVAAEIGITGI
jgi:LDH2 family malate/lactate/ureidoglycolate dehydrogenase